MVNPIMLVFYAILVICALHNTVRFVLCEGRYRNFHISFFYALVFAICICRVTWLCLILKVVTGYSSLEPPFNASVGAESQAIFSLDVAATQLELLTGFQQSFSMYELYLMVKSAIIVTSIESESLRSTLITETNQSYHRASQRSTIQGKLEVMKR